MKKLIKKIAMVGLVGLMFLGSVGVAEAKVIQKRNKTYITMDKIERDENLEVLKYFKIKNAKVKFKNNTYTVEFKTNKKTSCKDVKKIVKQVAKKLHGSTIEKEFKEFRTYNILVKAKDKKGHTHISYIKGHKIIK